MMIIPPQRREFRLQLGCTLCTVASIRLREMVGKLICYCFTVDAAINLNTFTISAKLRISNFSKNLDRFYVTDIHEGHLYMIVGSTFDPPLDYIIRPPVRSNGRTYKMLVMFLGRPCTVVTGGLIKCS